MNKDFKTTEAWRDVCLGMLFFFAPFSIAGGTAAAFLLLIVTVIRFIKKKDRWQPNILIYGVAVYLFGAVLSILINTSFDQYFEYIREPYRLLVPFLVFHALRQNKSLILTIPLCVTLFLHAIYAFALFPVDSEHNTLRGIFDHRLTFGGVMFIPFPIFLSLLFLKKLPNAIKMPLGILTLTLAATLIAAGARTYWIAALVSLICLFGFLYKKTAVLMLIGVTLTGIVWLSGTIKDIPFCHQVATESKQDLSSLLTMPITRFCKSSNEYVIRKFLIMSGFDVLKNDYVFGAGPDNKRQMHDAFSKYKEMYPKEKLLQHETGLYGAHNIYLQVWLDYGLIGIIGFLLIWAGLLSAIIFTLRRQKAKGTIQASILRGCFASMIGILYAGMFENNFYDGEVEMMIMILFGLTLACVQQIRDLKKQRL